MRCAALIILQVLCLITCAQNNAYRFDTYTTRHGLSNNRIHCMIRDHRDFMWIGTAEGLNRFDGTRFISFFSDQADTMSLTGNNIFDILEYKPGHLLIATNNGLSVFNTFTNGFENNKIKIQALQRGSGMYVRSLFRDTQSRIYINYAGAIDVFNDSLRFLYRLTDLPWAQSLRGVVVSQELWMQDREGRIWLPTDNRGVFIIDEKKQMVHSVSNNPAGYPFMLEAPIRSFLYDEDSQVVWYSTWGNGLFRYDIKNRQLKHQLFDLAFVNEGRCINSITKANERELICGGGQAIYSVDAVTLDYKIINENSDPNSLTALIGSCILNDTSYIWIGTETKGLMKFPATASLVVQTSLPFPVHNYTNSCTGIAYSENKNLYLAYGPDGLVEIDPVSQRTLHYTLPAAIDKTRSTYRIAEDHENQLWVASTTGIFIFDQQTKKFKRPDWLPAYVSQLHPFYMFCDSKGNMWISFVLPDAIGYYEAATKKFHYYENYIVNGKRVFEELHRISKMTEDENGNIWMISHDGGGVLQYDTRTQHWNKYPDAGKASALLSYKELNGVYSAGQNAIWLTNEEGLGLVKYHYKDGNTDLITRKDGLLSDNMLAITKGKDNNLFLVSAAGINLFDPATKEIRSLRLTDENINLSFAYHPFYDSLHKQLVYGLNDRVVFVKDKVWESFATKQVTYIDHITVNNKPVYFDPVQQKLSLPYSGKNISISFASPCYTENSSISYSYKMEDVDKDWIVTTQSPTANYTNLSPGSYSFLVKTKNQAGEWGPVNHSLQIVIAPPFWQTWWFLSACIIFISLSLYALFRRRIKTVRHEAELKQKIAETEMIALRAQMNPHFIFNCLNSIDNLIQSSQKEKATTYLAKFAKLIRAILENSKNNVIPCWKDLETLTLYLELEEFRWDKKFSYTLNIADEILQGDYKVPPLVIQPFVENAIHHGLLNKTSGDKMLTISVAIEHNYIKYTVEDNGIGRAQASVYKKINKPSSISLGMELTTERINLFNQKNNGAVTITDLADANHLPAGTRVEVCLVNQS
jgi:ligand-binding sensor domain-containing protein